MVGIEYTQTPFFATLEHLFKDIVIRNKCYCITFADLWVVKSLSTKDLVGGGFGRSDILRDCLARSWEFAYFLVISEGLIQL